VERGEEKGRKALNWRKKNRRTERRIIKREEGKGHRNVIIEVEGATTPQVKVRIGKRKNRVETSKEGKRKQK